jgi:hypothetical protein
MRRNNPARTESVPRAVATGSDEVSTESGSDRSDEVSTESGSDREMRSVPRAVATGSLVAKVGRLLSLAVEHIINCPRYTSFILTNTACSLSRPMDSLLVANIHPDAFVLSRLP